MKIVRDDDTCNVDDFDYFDDGDGGDFYVNLYWILSPADGVPSTRSSSLCLELVMENLIMTMVDMMRVRMTMMVMVVIMVMMMTMMEIMMMIMKTLREKIQG